MFDKFKTLLLILSLLIIAIPSTIIAEENITWMNTDFPPLGIGSGEHIDKGIGDMVGQILTKNLKNYKHSFKRANLKRILNDIGKGKNVCIAALIKNDKRSQFVHYNSVPSVIISPLSVIIKKDDAKLFGNKNEVSLKELLDNKNLTIGISEKMSFSDEIDPILEKYKNKPHVKHLNMLKLNESLLKMIAKGRIHYTISYSSTVGFLASKLDMKDKFKSLKIKENKTPIILHVGCPKNEWGILLAKEIDNILKNIRHTDEYRRIMEHWLIKKNIEEYRKMYDDVFLKMD